MTPHPTTLPVLLDWRPALAASRLRLILHRLTAENQKRPKPGIARYKPCMWIFVLPHWCLTSWTRLVASSIKVMKLAGSCALPYHLPACMAQKAKFQCKKKTHASHVALLSGSFRHRDDPNWSRVRISEHTCSVSRSVS